MGSLSPWHWAILAVAVIILFGAKRLPEAARALGKSLRIFKSEVRELQNENKSEPPAAPTSGDRKLGEAGRSGSSPSTTVQSERVEPPAADGRSG